MQFHLVHRNDRFKRFADFRLVSIHRCRVKMPIPNVRSASNSFGNLRRIDQIESERPRANRRYCSSGI